MKAQRGFMVKKMRERNHVCTVKREKESERETSCDTVASPMYATRARDLVLNYSPFMGLDGR